MHNGHAHTEEHAGPREHQRISWFEHRIHAVQPLRTCPLQTFAARASLLEDTMEGLIEGIEETWSSLTVCDPLPML